MFQALLGHRTALQVFRLELLFDFVGCLGGGYRLACCLLISEVGLVADEQHQGLGVDLPHLGIPLGKDSCTFFLAF